MVGVHVCMLGWAFMYVCYAGHSCVSVRVGVHVCFRLGIHVCVLGWAFMCDRVDVHVCVLGWAFMYVC